jgi:hypothetical protein
MQAVKKSTYESQAIKEKKKYAMTVMEKLFFKFFLVLVFITAVFSRPLKVETHFVGIVTEVKIISIDNQNKVEFWVNADKTYTILGKGHIPYIYINDSLFEYWVNYQRVGIGTTKNPIFYEIIK